VRAARALAAYLSADRQSDTAAPKNLSHLELARG